MQYKLQKHHGLAAVLILMVGMISVRSRSYVSDFSLVTWMLFIVAISSGYASYFLKAKMLIICSLSWIAGSAVTWFRPSPVGCLNCFLEVRDSLGSTGESFVINSGNIFLVATALSVASIIFGGLVGYLVSRYREWITVNAVSSLLLIVAVISTGYLGFEYGEEIMPRVSRDLAALLCASIGLFFSVTWICTNRPFVMPRKRA